MCVTLAGSIRPAMKDCALLATARTEFHFCLAIHWIRAGLSDATRRQVKDDS